MDEEKWVYNAKVITKYNPIYYDDGKYLNDEWTSHSDVGRIFNGNIFTIDEYINVEFAYLLSVRKFMEFVQSDKLVAKDVHKNSSFTNMCRKRDYDLYMLCKELKNNLTITGENINLILKLVLREYVQVTLLVDKDTESYVHFGYDYYMYFNSNENIDEIKKYISSLGLFMRG